MHVVKLAHLLRADAHITIIVAENQRTRGLKHGRSLHASRLGLLELNYQFRNDLHFELVRLV